MLNSLSFIRNDDCLSLLSDIEREGYEISNLLPQVGSTNIDFHKDKLFNVQNSNEVFLARGTKFSSAFELES